MRWPEMHKSAYGEHRIHRHPCGNHSHGCNRADCAVTSRIDPPGPPIHDEDCESEFIGGAWAWSACGCGERAEVAGA